MRLLEKPIENKCVQDENHPDQRLPEPDWRVFVVVPARFTGGVIVLVSFPAA
jgi:hypothetical protein